MNTSKENMVTAGELPPETQLLTGQALKGRVANLYNVAFRDGHKRGMTWGIFIGAAIAWGSYLIGWVLFRGF